MKGHGMELSLNKPTSVSSNETPTPTRFIRNCEAIGLFQDLKDLNPFEETFKKAVENATRGTPKTQGGSFLSKPAGDDLHTPQVCLEGSETVHIEIDEDEQPERVEEVVVRSEADTSISAELAPPPTPQPANSGNATEESVHVLFEMPNGTVLQLSAKPVKDDGPEVRDAFRIAPVKTVSNEAIFLTTSHVPSSPVPTQQTPANPLVKEKLKAFLDGSIKAKQDKVPPAPPPKHVAIPPLKKLLNSSNVEHKRTYPLVSDPANETDEDKKRKILERNRKAASRCREKRKRHVENLMNDNRILTQEVVALRAEVLRLQTLLMAHSNCSVTTSQSNTLTSTALTQVVTSEPQRTPVSSSSDDTIFIVDNPMSTPEPAARARVQQRKERLTLDIAKATENTMMDLDSPSIVRRDEVLASVGPPATPDERIDPFVDLERDISEPFEKQLNSTTTVIQLNPNVLKGSHTS